MTTPKFLLALALSALLPAAPALAKQRAIAFTHGSFVLSGNATQTGHSIVLPEGSNASVSMNIFLPPDYKKNSVIRLRLTASATETCNTRLRVTQFIRIRNGEEMYNNLAGITAVNGNTAAATGNAQVFGRTYEIRPLDFGPVQGQKPGDILHVKISRESMHAEDTCTGPVYAFGANARYTYVP